ncbi:cation-translocating P-type ATPase [Mediterraneibacter glycyrrhizinilyticus]|uniref:cation-translocating P-type ATPase n=1 Tax=Mediterraneibacter glycyrrhizinilyticus TaxID=342942 RepID=UPI001D064395|nr:cation-translocating P-type ATPase [Mediterraneibacter glycyrrhizinilyticus]MCB6308837.1 cation-translocating P-type ATPase [Lachnospiraceae bacterium 210521-DFI.1.109]MCB6425961.1 cation-translocating P-type ATPase [Mediterraneibacter glycyrrhizinilyticus]
MFIKKEKEKQEAEETKRRIPTTRYEPDYKEGLTSRQVQEHRMHGWTNRSVDPPSKTTKEIIHENIFTYFNLIFAVLALVLCLVGAFRDLTFLPVIIANTLIGIIQEVRAKQILDKLTMLHAPHAAVIRDGKRTMIDAEELVLDDIAVFQAGNQVCADAIVCEGEVQVNESLLTGEADEITKRKGDLLMSGSFIVSGQCHARLDQVGEDSYISKLTIQAKEAQVGEQSEMIRSLDKLVKWVGIAIIPMGLILFAQAYFLQHDGFRESITSMVAAVIGMIPEGLYLLASVALAVSSIRLAQKKVLLHDMKCIETLARVDVLCVDKTGTITENEMEVQDVIETDAYDAETMEPLSVLIGDFAAAMDEDNITMRAVKMHFKTGSGKKPLSKCGFSSTVKYSSVTFEDGEYVLGAPEMVLKERYETYEAQFKELTENGARVLAFGIYDGECGGKPLEQGIVPLGFLRIVNPIRESAKETFSYFAEQGVDVKVISGDNPLTVSRVAAQAGICNADRYTDASTLRDEDAVKKALLENTVFGRVTPEQKRQFVRLLKEAGHTVAMTGDGVNDVLALKDADCSIAMASGSDAAAQASQLVLLESDFSCMPQVVLEGRRVVNNIQRSASLFLVKNIFSFLLSVISLVFLFTYPLEPSQISLISMFTIGIPAFFLALESNRNIIRGHFLTNVFLKALPAALTDAVAVGALVIFGRTFGVKATDISTAATMLLAIVGFMILYTISAPLNKLRGMIFASCVAGLLFCAVFLNDLFAITGMTTECVMLFVVFAIATEPVLRYLTVLVEKLRFYYLRLRGRDPKNG